jgi:hypothetical protein
MPTLLCRDYSIIYVSKHLLPLPHAPLLSPPSPLSNLSNLSYPVLFLSPSTTTERVIGNLDFAVTDHAVGEVSKGYLSHQLDGASAVKRDVNRKMLKHIHMQWMRSEGIFSPPAGDGAQSDREDTVWIHYTDMNGYHQVGSINDEQRKLPPYFTMLKNNRDINSYRRGGDTNIEVLDGLQDAGDSTVSKRAGSGLGPGLGLGLMSGMRASDSMSLEWDLVEEEVRSIEREEVGTEWGDDDASTAARPLSLKTAINRASARGREGTKSEKVEIKVLPSSMDIPYQVTGKDLKGDIDANTHTRQSEVTLLESDRRSLASHDATFDHLSGESDTVAVTEIESKPLREQLALMEGHHIPDSSSVESSPMDQYQHINLFLGDSEEGLFIQDFFSFHNISSSTACMAQIQDLLRQYVRPSLSRDNTRCWVRDKGVAGDVRGVGILSESDSGADFTFESATTSSSSSVPTPMDMDDQFEKTYRGALSPGSRSVSVSAVTPVSVPAPVPSPVHPEVFPVNPFGPIGQMLTMEKTDAVSGWRHLRHQMYDTPLSSLSAPREDGYASEEDGRDTLDVYFEIKETTEAQWSSQESLEKWRRNLKMGDILDVFVNCTSAGAVWAEGRINNVGEKSYGYGYCSIRVELLGGASQEFLDHVRGPGQNSRTFKNLLEKDGKLYFGFDSSSTNLQPLYSHSMNWRAELKEGSKLFCAVRKDAWMSATVSTVEDEDGHPGDTLTVLIEGPPSPRPSPPVESYADRECHSVESEDYGASPDVREEASQALEDRVNSADSRVAKGVMADSPPLPLRLSPMLKTVNRYSDRISFFIADLPNSAHTEEERLSNSVNHKSFVEDEDFN